MTLKLCYVWGCLWTEGLQSVKPESYILERYIVYALKMGKGEERVREIIHAWEKMLRNIRDMRQNITYRVDMVKTMRIRMTDPRSFSKHVLESSLEFSLSFLFSFMWFISGCEV